MDAAWDDRLSEDLARGCPRAYAELYDRFGQPLYRAARTMLRSGSEAEDAVQDVFVSLVRSRSRLPHVDNLAAYLFTALRHAVARRLAEREDQRQGLRLLAEWSRTASAAVRMPEQREAALEQALSLLPREQREVIALKIDGGLTFAQIAQVLGISPNTAASRYRYALEKLREALGEQS